MANIVYIGMSLDGFIADRNGQLNFLECVPNPHGDDFGYGEFMERVDALVMGRVTMETVLSFGIDWPYTMPVFVLSSTLTAVPEELDGKVEIVNGDLSELVDGLHAKGYENLYIDGGKVIKSFLKEDLIDEMILTRLPILVGSGTPLFGDLSGDLEFEHVQTDILLGEIVQSHYCRKRSV